MSDELERVKRIGAEMAFPGTRKFTREFWGSSASGVETVQEPMPGMSFRQYAAVEMMGALMSNPATSVKPRNGATDEECVAAAALMLADALIAELAREG